MWAASLEDINRHNYDYVKLSRISISVDIGLPSPLCMLVGFDGSLLLPSVSQFESLHSCVEQFNRVLGWAVLGGIFFRAIDHTDVSKAIFYPTGYYRMLEPPQSHSGRVRYLLKSKLATPLDTILLLEPEKLSAHTLSVAIKKGQEFNSISTLSPDFLLRGLSDFRDANWSDAVSHLWIVIEQVLSFLWDGHVLHEVQANPVPGRQNLLRDQRAWTSALRIEVLFQAGLIDSQTYGYLQVARKARNRLAHEGARCKPEDGNAAVDAVFRLVSLAKYSDSEVLVAISQNLKQTPAHGWKEYSDRFASGEVKYWLNRRIPPIPGEKECGDQSFENPYTFRSNEK
jgi:hypothetical protein